MKLHTLILATALFSLTTLAQVKVSHFPANTKFLVHLDVKRLVNSKTGDLLQESMDDKSKRKMESFKALSGIDFMRDIDSIYITGSEGEKDKGAVYATGRFDVEKLTAILGGNDDFKSQPFGKHKILTWADKGETHHGCFVNSGLAVAADNMDVLRNCLSLIDGKGESLPTDSAFAAIVPGKANRFISIAAQDVNSLASAGNSADSSQPGKPNQLQMLQSAKSLVFCVDQTAADKADLMLRAAVSASDTEKAQQLAQMIQGIQAMMMMQAAENPEVAQMAQNLKIKSEDTKIQMSFKLSEEQLRKQINEARKKAAQSKDVEDVPPPAPAQVVAPE